MDMNKNWNGMSMSQQDFMEKDTVLVVDHDDRVIGSESKRASHEFNLQQPKGVLHRAFSVFIFDASTHELLLQQRAKEKITFPSVGSLVGSMLNFYWVSKSAKDSSVSGCVKWHDLFLVVCG